MATERDDGDETGERARGHIRIPYHPRANFINWTWPSRDSSRTARLHAVMADYQRPTGMVIASCSYASSARRVAHSLPCSSVTIANDGDSTK